MTISLLVYNALTLTKALSESPKPIYVQDRMISLSSASDFSVVRLHLLSFYVRYSPNALFFSSEHDKTISFAGAAGLINRKCVQSTTIGDADGSENKKVISPHPPCRVVMIDRLSDLIADSQTLAHH